MLKIILGRAGSGKTSAIMRRILDNANKSNQKSIVIVPEQYSHDAERQMAAICGNQISLYAEVLSFSRLTTRVINETGGIGDKMLDSGGRVLVMNRALESVLSQMRLFRQKHKLAEFLPGLISTYDEFSAANISIEDIESAEIDPDSPLFDKISDLMLIFGAYEALIPEGQTDPRSRIKLLADRLAVSETIKDNAVYIDGFTDFTAVERLAVEELVRLNIPLTVCLTCDDLSSSDPVFDLARETANALLRFAEEHNITAEIELFSSDAKSRPEELVYLDNHLYSFDDEAFAGASESIELFEAKSVLEECELTASKITELVRDRGYRYGDIAVVAADWSKYESVAEDVFSKYNVPIHITRKEGILRKPVLLIISSVLNIILNSWDYVDVFEYLKTNLTGISLSERDDLENYVLKWNIRGSSMWTRAEGWSALPGGFKKEAAEEDIERLERLNAVRECVAAPIKELEDAMKSAYTIHEKIIALYSFAENIALYDQINARIELLRKSSREQTAAEYAQLWEIFVSALEQMDAASGELAVTTEEFASLLNLLLSQYDVATIPVTLDRVSIGDITRMRRRDIKCLFIIGASEDALPNFTPQEGIITEDERDTLVELGIELGDSAEHRLSRAMNSVYSSITLASDRLTLSYSAGDSGKTRESMVMRRIANIFSLPIFTADYTIKLSAPEPCFELAADAEQNSPEVIAARKYFAADDRWRRRLENVQNVSRSSRGKLSPEMVEKLYSKQLNLTASRVDKFVSCRFSYFIQYSLKARPRKKAEFDAPELGNFMHFVLENVAKDADAAGGFAALTEKDCKSLVRKYVQQYITDVLGGFDDKSSRFRYLFERLLADVEQVVLDLADELSNSDFKPIEFELDFSYNGDIPPVHIESDETVLDVSGKVDRVDGWIEDGKLYIRVVDYKTGKKAFNLADVWYGMGLQMLMYLFAIEKNGKSRYNMEIVPAGVLYQPARDVILNMPRGATDEEIAKERAKKLVRSGLVLNSEEVIEAMEHGNSPKYIPVKFKKDGTPTGTSLTTLAEMGMLSEHIDRKLTEVAKAIRDGEINADPYYRNAMDNACLYCDYAEACHFDEENGDDKRRFLSAVGSQEAMEKIGGGLSE